MLKQVARYFEKTNVETSCKVFSNKMLEKLRKSCKNFARLNIIEVNSKQNYTFIQMTLQKLPSFSFVGSTQSLLKILKK